MRQLRKTRTRCRPVTDAPEPGPGQTADMLATVTFTPDPQVGMVPISAMIRDRLEPFGLRVTHLDRYEATIEGEFDDIVDGLRSLGGSVIRRAGSRAVMHLHVTLGEFDTTDPPTSSAYDELCERFLHPSNLPAGDSGVPL